MLAMLLNSLLESRGNVTSCDTVIYIKYIFGLHAIPSTQLKPLEFRVRRAIKLSLVMLMRCFSESP